MDKLATAGAKSTGILKKSENNQAVSKEEDDDPSFSSAAQCIELNLSTGQEGNHCTFGPVFTHQCFEGEWIRGYQPMVQRHDTKNHQQKRQQQQHASFDNHNLAKHFLKISVQLSPSCTSCKVDLQIFPKTNGGSTDNSTTNGSMPPPAKRQKLNTNDESEKPKKTSGVSFEKGVTFHGEDSKPKSDDNNINPEPMTADEILRLLQTALPPISATDQQETKTTDTIPLTNDSYLQQPIGNILETYTRVNKNSSSDEEFVVTLCKGTEARDYHLCVQNLARFYIECADEITPDQTDGGYWKMLYLFQKHKDGATTKYSFSGYLTLFYIQSPFKRPKPGMVLRVCQALLLPPFQRQGHGTNLLKILYTKVVPHDNQNNQGDYKIVQVNVEDPAPAFTRLRNKVDLGLLKMSFLQKDNGNEPWLPSMYDNKNKEKSKFTPLKKSHATQAASKGYITERQVHIAYELYKLEYLLQQQQQEQKMSVEEDWEKQYRLMVKKRLLKTIAAELRTMESKEDRQACLAQHFEQVLAEYKSLLAQSK